MQPNAKDLLDNIMWNSLTGPHARFASGEGNARRYAKGFSPIVGSGAPIDAQIDTEADAAG